MTTTLPSAVEAKYFLLSDINLNIKVRIRQLHGRKVVEELQQRLADRAPVSTTKDLELFVTCAVFSNGAMIGLPVSTKYRCFGAAIRWDQWLTLPVKYRDLSPTARLVFTVWDATHAYARTGAAAAAGSGDGAAAVDLAASTSSLGSATGATGVQHQQQRSALGDLLHTVPLVTPPAVAAVLAQQAAALAAGGSSGSSNGVPNANANANPQLLDARSDPSVIVLGGSSLPLFNKKGVLKSGRRKLFLWPGMPGDGGAPNTTTPYRLAQERAVDRLEKVIRSYSQKPVASVKWLDKLVLRRIEKLQEKEEHDITAGAALNSEHMYLVVEFPPFKHPVVYHQKPCNATLPELQSMKDRDRVAVLHDPEATRDNPIEAKYHKLARSAAGLADENVKPKMKERKRLAQIIASPNKHLLGEDKSLLWRFRLTLRENKHALTKFLRSVDWADVNETKQAVTLMERWTPIDIADALELLSKFFKNKEVRAYAVTMLRRADNDELSDYLLQLVQALRYESHYPSFLSEFLIERCSESLELANFFHWYLTVEKYDKVKGAMFTDLHEHFLLALKKTPRGKDWEKILNGQASLVTALVSLSENAKSAKGKVEKKAERLRSLLTDKGDFKHLREFESCHLPVRPGVIVKGLIGEESTMFKSAMAPLLACFKLAAPIQNADKDKDKDKDKADQKDGKTPPEANANPNAPPGGPKMSVSVKPGEGAMAAAKAFAAAVAASQVPVTYKTIFKSGDDLRQDQLILQMITLMDNLLRKVKLDLKLTAYRVLATAPNAGFVEFVPKSYSLTYVLQNFQRNIKTFFDHHNPKASQIATVLDTFVRSCAGYCVITYLLGIGDRHLENLLLTTDGHLFHIDFGYIFGRDPKPFPPPMKFCKEMVEAMGGQNSEMYKEFRKFTALAFNLLRPHANLILNLLSLMGDANIPHLSANIEQNMLKVQEKFRLDLTDEEAETYILQLVDDSVGALFPQAMDIVHNWAMYWK